MAALTMNTELPGQVKTTALTGSESAVTISSSVAGLEGPEALVQVWADADWTYNSTSGGSVNAPVASGRVLTMRVSRSGLVFYAKTASSANLYVITL